MCAGRGEQLAEALLAPVDVRAKAFRVDEGVPVSGTEAGCFLFEADKRGMGGEEEIAGQVVWARGSEERLHPFAGVAKSGKNRGRSSFDLQP